MNQPDSFFKKVRHSVRAHLSSLAQNWRIGDGEETILEYLREGGMLDITLNQPITKKPSLRVSWDDFGPDTKPPETQCSVSFHYTY